MCGICGIIGERNEILIKTMTRSMIHRGPNDEGFYLDEKVSFGMRRLSIIDIGSGRQPISNEDGSIWIVFNGEIYNFKELRSLLEAKGHIFKTQCDTEVIVHGYEEYGEGCVHHLRGMFAFAIHDKINKKIFIARDRLGIKPLYYAQTNGKFFFASEIKAILCSDDISREVNLSALDNYLTFQYVPTPDTMFKGIMKLPPGHILIYRHGDVKIEKYWDVHFCAQESKSNFHDIDEIKEKLYQLLNESVRLRLISDVPFGALLSGGIDSSTVVALMSQVMNMPVKTFTVGFSEEKDYDETKFARKIARHLGTEHHEFFIRPSATEILPKLIWHMDEPIADQAALPTYLICELARDYVTVLLTGEGGDEIFGGYPRYLLSKIASQYQKVPKVIRDKFCHNVISALPGKGRFKNMLNKITDFGDDLINLNLNWVSNFNYKEKENLYSHSFRGLLSRDNALDIVRSYADGDSSNDSLSKLQYIDIKTWLVDNVLMKVDKMSMAASVEVRVPFLDHKLVEFMTSVPSHLKLRGITNKYILKEVVSNILPKEIINRKKQAFRLPTKEWFRKELKELISSILLDSKTQRRGYFNYDYINWMINEHLKGKNDFHQKLWNLICLELWHRIYIDGGSGIAADFKFISKI